MNFNCIIHIKLEYSESKWQIVNLIHEKSILRRPKDAGGVYHLNYYKRQSLFKELLCTKGFQIPLSKDIHPILTMLTKASSTHGPKKPIISIK